MSVLRLVEHICSLHADPTLTLPNLVSLVEGVISWRVNLGERLRVPFLKLHEIDMNSLSKPEKKEVMLKEWLENHPAPSWMGVARSLYRSAGLPEHAALRSMYGKYLKGIYIMQCHVFNFHVLYI